MTTLNINQPYFAAMITDSGERIELGKAVWPQIQERAFANLKAIDEDISAAMIVIGITKESMNKMAGKGSKPRYAHEGENPDSPLYGMPAEMIARIQQIDDDAPSPFEGITMSRLMEAQASDEYKAWVHMAINPENRVGISDGVIDSLRQQWQNAFPDVAAHTPIWKD